MPATSPEIHVHVYITGQVQGVGYRLSTAEMATTLGLRGWVRNLADGRVEAVFEGNEIEVERMLSWCQQGPSAAVVTNVLVEYNPLEGIQGFKILRR